MADPAPQQIAPAPVPAETASVSGLARLVEQYPRLVVLTGAGISTCSGIPAYRDQTGKWLGSDPIQHGDFIAHAHMRQRYWARSAFGWGPVADAVPNAAHRSLVDLERAEWVDLLVTQNVDRLHQKAGHRRVIDLHGRLDRVRCLACGDYQQRLDYQSRLLAANPVLRESVSGSGAALAPDGDAWVDSALVSGLEVPGCEQCGGVMMPDVVFFGGAVPADRVVEASTAVERCDALMVVGSSLMVYSGLRFCRIAHRLGKPIIAINRGATRGDDLLTMKLEMDCAEALTALADRLR